MSDRWWVYLPFVTATTNRNDHSAKKKSTQQYSSNHGTTYLVSDVKRKRTQTTNVCVLE